MLSTWRFCFETTDFVCESLIGLDQQKEKYLDQIQLIKNHHVDAATNLKEKVGIKTDSYRAEYPKSNITISQILSCKPVLCSICSGSWFLYAQMVGIIFV